MTDRLKKSIKTMISMICYYGGIVWLLRTINGRKGIVILAYHRISDEDENFFNLSLPAKIFDLQLRYLAKHYQVVSLEKALEQKKKKSGRPVAVLTFDDGYRDNYLTAYPLLRKYNLPATLFLTVHPIQKQSTLWYDTIKNIILNTREEKIDLKRFGLRVYPLKTEKDKKTTLSRLVSEIKTSDRFVDLKDIIHFLQEKLENGHKTHIQDALLNFEDIREMQKNGITFAGHTLNHPILTRIPHDQMTKEISESKQILEKELNQSIDYFAYPNGDRADYDPAIIEQLRRAGYRGACTLISGINIHPNPFELKRYGIDLEFGTGRFAKHIFAAEICGLFDLLFFRHLRGITLWPGLKKTVSSRKGEI